MDRSVGIDVAEERKGLDLVALDADRQVIASLGHATVAELWDARFDGWRRRS